MWSSSPPSLMTMKTSCISPSQWSNRDQHVSTPAATKAFAWLVSSETACAIWFVLDPKWVSVTRVLRLCVVRGVCQQRHEVTGKYTHRTEIISCDVCLTFGARCKLAVFGSWPGALQGVPSG